MRRFKTLDFLIISVCCAILITVGFIDNNLLFELLGIILFVLYILDIIREIIKEKKYEKD